jgi:lipopolysaccharide exporter
MTQTPSDQVTQTNHSWVRSGVYALAEKFMSLIWAFGTIFFLTRIFPKEQYGVWEAFLVVTAILEVTRSGLIQNGLVRALAISEKDELGTINTAGLILNLTISLLVIILILIFSGQIERALNAEGLGLLLKLYAITNFILTFFFHFNFIQQAHFDFKAIFFSAIFFRGSVFLYAFYHWWKKIPFDLIELVYVQILGVVLGTLVGFLFARNYFSLVNPLASNVREKLVELFRYGISVFGTNMATMVHKSVDKILLSSMLSPGSLATYGVAMRLGTLVEVPVLSMASVLFPKSAREGLESGNAGMKRLYEKAVGIILGLIIPLVLIVLIFPRFFIKILAGSNYFDGIPVLKITVLFGIFVAFAVQFGTILDASGHQVKNFRMTLLGAIISILLNVFLIPKYGIMGAAIATLISYFIMFILQLILLNKLFGVTPGGPWKYTLEFYQMLFFKLTNFFGIKSNQV